MRERRVLTFQKVTIFNCQPHKMVKPTQTFRRQIGDELFECV